MQLEETQVALAEAVVFLRSHFCPYHDHVNIAIVTHDGPTVWHGPACEVPELGVECEYHREREELLERCYEALGTKDMSRYV